MVLLAQRLLQTTKDLHARMKEWSEDELNSYVLGLLNKLLQVQGKTWMRRVNQFRELALVVPLPAAVETWLHELKTKPCLLCPCILSLRWMASTRTRCVASMCVSMGFAASSWWTGRGSFAEMQYLFLSLGFLSTKTQTITKPKCLLSLG